jgi:hypothetical protein
VAILKSPDELRALLLKVKTIAVVGLSSDPTRDSHHVGEYLISRGYRVIPINPKYSTVLGRVCHRSLEDLPEADRSSVDLVDVFRRPEEAVAVAREAVRLKLPAIWFQLGVATPEAVAEADRAGLEVVAESCLMVAHRLLKVPAVSWPKNDPPS